MGSQPPELWVEVVFLFWFSELVPSDWFSARSEVDALIHERFGGLHSALAHDPPATDELDARGHVSAVVVFDQFSRNLFRRSSKTYAMDPLALAYATNAVEKGLDVDLGLRQRQFLYMPFMHSEDRGHQARSVELFAMLGQPDLLRFAKHHKAIVDQFGRFPHRNEVLKRISTPQEKIFLRSLHAFP